MLSTLNARCLPVHGSASCSTGKQLRQMNNYVKQRILLFLLPVAMIAALLAVGLVSWKERRTSEAKQRLETNIILETDTIRQEAPLIPKETARVAYVIDGDTIELETGERVRLIGIDAPEFGKLYFSESRSKLAELILDKDVQLEKDESDKDGYGRLLRYAHRGDIFINFEMVRLGYAKVLLIPPDLKYKDLFLAAEHAARQKQFGIWGR